MKNGPSLVELRLPRSAWRLAEFCVDDACVPPGDRQRVNGARVDIFKIEVNDTPGTYHYRVELTAPDGTTFDREGDVQTQGDDASGEGCVPSRASASITVAADGEVTIDSP